MSSAVFEPSYIWNRDEEKNESKSLLARLLPKKKENAPEVFKKNIRISGKYEKLAESPGGAQAKIELKILKIADLDDGSLLVICKWSNESKTLEKRFVKEAEAEKFLSDCLQTSNYRVGELLLELRKFRFESNKSTVATGKLTMRMENLGLFEWWIQKMEMEKGGEMNVLPFGDKAINIPKDIFDLPQFRHCRILRLMEHCCFSTEQFLSFCSTTPHFSFYSDAISESVMKNGLEKCQELKDFVVLEWFFSAKFDTKRIVKELVRPKGERKERLNIQTQSFDPVEVFSVCNENDRKLSLMIVEDVSSFKPYSLVLYA